jgi:four helix bundle protein
VGGRIKSFTNLIVWNKGHQLVIEIYGITSKFPPKETFSLVDQMRRAVVSVTSNIAESFNRQTNKEKVQFYYMALGSLSELQNQLLIAKDVGYLETEKFRKLAGKTIELSKLLNGLIKSVKRV